MLGYDVCMKKRRVTLNLDEDVVQALESVDARSISTAANRALREALAVEAHRSALLRWLDELDSAHGAADPAGIAAAEALADELEVPAPALETR